jgi:peptidoglycan/LPS O-acetylase OafA/YrhL
MNTDASWRYRPALDGVRAVAVAAVLVFHARPDWLPGGFVGVDVFFVLSGFLITGTLLSEARSAGVIRLAAFWGRRARRLLPALLLVLVTVAVGARYLRPAQELPSLRLDALAALAYMANWRMLFHGGDYFVRTGPASPLQHTWSLGIEEQFYLLWPLIVAGMLRWRRSRSALLALCVTGTGAAALLCAVLYRPGGDPARVYYGTDTRAGALLAGCALAVLLAGRTLRPTRWLTAAATGAGVLLVAVMVLARGESGWLYRGGLTVVALAVAVVLAFLIAAPGSYPTLLLSLGPVVWVGRISYGLYLWHWPLFAAFNAQRTGLTGVALFVLRIAVTVAVAAASYHLVELPIRRGRGLRLAPAAAAAVATAVTATAAVVVVASIVPVPPPRWGSVSQAEGATGPLSNTASPPSRPATPPPIARPGRAPGGEPRIAIFGDSVAWTLGEYLLPLRGALSITNRAVQGCGIARLPDLRYLDSPHTNYPGCEQWDERWGRDVSGDDPDVSVILLDRWELMDRNINGRYLHVGDPDYDGYVTGELKLAISIASAKGARVALLTAPYTHRDERPDGTLYPEDTPERVDNWNHLLAREAATNPAHPTILDLNRVVCPGGEFTWSVGGIRVRSDGLHFTPEGVQQVIAPWLLPRLNQLATS